MLISNAHTSHLLLDREISESGLQQSSAPNAEGDHTISAVSLVKKKFHIS
jgi:hypothetical protein